MEGNSAKKWLVAEQVENAALTEEIRRLRHKVKKRAKKRVHKETKSREGTPSGDARHLPRPAGQPYGKQRE